MKLILILTVAFTLLFFSCNLKNKGKIKPNESKKFDLTLNPRDTLSLENFDFFVKKFYSDSIFQIGRIIFPLESEDESEKEYFEALKDSNLNEVSYNKHKHYDKNTWIMVSDAFFKDDSIATFNGIKYKRRFLKTDNIVKENILYAEPEQIMIISKFKLINRKWYMVDFKDGFAVD